MGHSVHGMVHVPAALGTLFSEVVAAETPRLGAKGPHCFIMDSLFCADFVPKLAEDSSDLICPSMRNLELSGDSPCSRARRVRGPRPSSNPVKRAYARGQNEKFETVG